MDGDHVPFDPTATVTSTEPPTVQVDCAIEYFDAEAQPTNFGLIAPVPDRGHRPRRRLRAGQGVLLRGGRGDRYDYRRTEPPNGLFDVGVYTMHFTSNSET
jgi:hypothetical protein